MKVFEILKVNQKRILVCEVFEDDMITNKIRINSEVIDNFTVEPVRNCFSTPATRNIVLSDYSGEKITEVEFV